MFGESHMGLAFAMMRWVECFVLFKKFFFFLTHNYNGGLPMGTIGEVWYGCVDAHRADIGYQNKRAHY
jgi:hypothetical protein